MSKRVGVRPRLTYRHPNQVHLVWANDASARAFRVQGTDTLAKVYAGTYDTMFDVRNNTSYRSPGLQRQRRGIIEGSTKGLTTASFDIADFGGTNIRTDDDLLFLRISRINHAGTVVTGDTVFVVPPPLVFGTPQPVVTLSATAPGVAAPATGAPPATVPGLTFPAAVQALQVRNLDAADPLFIGYDRGMPMIQIPFGQVESFADSGTEGEVFIRCNNGDSVSFTLYVTLLMGSY